MTNCCKRPICILTHRYQTVYDITMPAVFLSYYLEHDIEEAQCRKEKVADSKISGYVYTGPQSPLIIH